MDRRRTQIEGSIADLRQTSRAEHISELGDRDKTVGRPLQVIIGLVVVRNEAPHQRDHVAEVDLPPGVNHRIGGL